MSKNMCLQAVGPDLQFGQTGTSANSQVRGTTTGLQVRTPDLVSLDNMEGADPTIDTHFATKSYVDGVAVGLSWKSPVRVCTPVALPANTQTGAGATLTADVNGIIPTIDGVTVVVGNRVLVREEGGGTSTKNGIYDVTDVGTGGTPWILTRSSDALVGSDAAANAMFCEEGTAGADTAYVQTEDSPVLYNTDATTFLLFSSVVSGVTSIATAAGVTGITVLESGAAAVPTVRGILGQSGVLVASLSGTDVLVSVVAGGISTAQLDDGGVTPAKFAPLAAVSYQQGTIVFGDENSTVNIGSTSGNQIVVGTSIRVITPFTNPIAVNLEANSVDIMASDTNDVSTAGQYDCDDVTTNVGNLDAVLGISAGQAAGEALVTFCILDTGP